MPPVDWVRPFAVTGEIDYSIPTVTVNSDGSYNPTTLTYGATLQYSLLYENSFVHQTAGCLQPADSCIRRHFQYAHRQHQAGDPGRVFAL